LRGSGKALADLAGRPLGERRSEHGYFDVVVIVDLGSQLAGIGAEDAACVLNESPLERDRSRQERGVYYKAGELGTTAAELPWLDAKQVVDQQAGDD
jgi:hypothetical protein